MKTLGILLVSLFALCLFAVPAMAATDTVVVTVVIPELMTLDAGDAVTLTAVAADLTNEYIFGLDASTMTVSCNDTWTLNAKLGAGYVNGGALWIEDTETAGNSAGTGFVQITTLDTALNTIASYGVAGSYTYALDWLFTGVDWTTTSSTEPQTVTFTLAVT